jgi:hypothetical protein
MMISILYGRISNLLLQAPISRHGFYLIMRCNYARVGVQRAVPLQKSNMSS